VGTAHNPAAGIAAGTASGAANSPTGPASYISFKTQQVEPPSSVYATLDDKVIVALNVPTFALPITVRTMMRVLRPDGRVMPEQFDDVVNTQIFSVAHTISEGFVLSASAFVIAGAVNFPGAAYYRLVLVHGNLPQPDVQVPLIEDYISGSYIPTWPITPPHMPQRDGGHVRAVVFSAPAAGADFLITVPAVVRWRFMSLRASLTASATVGNRQVRIAVDDGANIFNACGSSVVQTAGQTIGYDFVAGLSTSGANANEATIGAPGGLVLAQGFRVSSVTTGILAGDQWSTQIVGVEEYVEM